MDIIDNNRKWLIFQLGYIHGQKKTFTEYFDIDKVSIRKDVYTNAFFKKGITNSIEFRIKNSCYCFQFGIKNSFSTRNKL